MYLVGIVHHKEYQSICQVVDVEKLSHRFACTPECYLLCFRLFRFVEFPYQSGQDVRCIEVEVVVDTVQIGRHSRDEVAAVLTAVELTQLEPRYFGNGIRLVRRLQSTREQILLFYRLRAHLGVNTRTAQKQQLTNIVPICGVYDIESNHHIVVYKLCGRGVVGYDASYFGGRQKDVLGLLCREEVFDSLLVTQIELFRRTHQYVVESFRLQCPYNSRPNQSSVSGDVYFRVLFHFFCVFIL